MFSEWYETDNDSFQHIRKDGNLYEMIQIVWLDTTVKDIKEGGYEYCVIKTELDLADITDDEIDYAISGYGYTREQLISDFGIINARDLVAECLMEENGLKDCNVIADAHSFKEAMLFIKKYIEGN